MRKKRQLIPILLLVACLAGTACTRSHSQQAQNAQTVELQPSITTPFQFVAYGDSRFHDPSDTEAANPVARQALVQAIAQIRPAFIVFTGDIVYNGYDANDWKIWDAETSVWRAQNIPIYPALGNHDLHGPESAALGNYFQRFPELKGSRYYSVRAANTFLLVLDSAMAETEGAQGTWLNKELDTLPAGVDFVFVVLHHPPYTSSSDVKKYGGGHSARTPEQVLAKMLEGRQQHSQAHFIVFSGHVHNYERHEHGGVTYFVSGGAGAHAYPIERAPDDPFQSREINYHYLLVAVDRGKLNVTMNRLDLSTGKPVWSQPDRVEITSPRANALNSDQTQTWHVPAR